MGEPAHQQHSTSFDLAADVYERARPGYPDEAVRWLLPAGARRVLDLAAGTGKLTRQLTGRGLDVVAVEPLAQMRARLLTAAPDAEALEGNAESIPLPDASVDAVFVAQAWHWFDYGRAVPEIARVLRPGGTLGLLWNNRDHSVPWVRELSLLLGDRSSIDRLGDELDDTPYFGPARVRDFVNRQVLDLPALRELVSSRSYVILRPEAERAALLDQVAELTRTHPMLAGRDTFELPYVTRCYAVPRT